MASSRLLVAAEPFEALTEQAFSATPAQLDKLVGEVETAAHQVNGLLLHGARSALGKRLAEIRHARKANHPSEVALASVEGYRILASATHGTKVPTAVSLLDYVGFRYDADLKSTPVRWADMQSAVKFGQKQWKSISGHVSDASLRNDFTQAIDGMHHAAANKSVSTARSTVTAELSLVDKLEKYFSGK